MEVSDTSCVEVRGSPRTPPKTTLCKSPNMAILHLSLAGEGRGHASRARTLLDGLRHRHRVVVWTFGAAYSFLQAYCREHAQVEIRRIPGLQFQYDRKGRLAYGRSLWHGARTLRSLARTVDVMAHALREEGADLVLTDFEPTLPRAARKVGVPVVALDHQSVFAHGDFARLPRELRWHAHGLGHVVRRWTPKPDLQISSSFYRPPARRGSEAVRFVGVLLRDSVRNVPTSRGGHLVAYLRPGTSSSTLRALRECPHPVLLYGLPPAAAGGSIVHRPISEPGFLSDLASCRALVSTAGNQLLGEAMYLGKPILALPEPGNREQEINGWFLQDSGAGRSLPCEAFHEQVLEEFLASEDSFREASTQLPPHGTFTAMHLIEQAVEGVCGADSPSPLQRRVKPA